MFSRNKSEIIASHLPEEVKNLKRETRANRKMYEDSLIKLIEEGKLDYDSGFFTGNYKKSKKVSAMEQPEQEPER